MYYEYLHRVFVDSVRLQELCRAARPRWEKELAEAREVAKESIGLPASRRIDHLERIERAKNALDGITLLQHAAEMSNAADVQITQSSVAILTNPLR